MFLNLCAGVSRRHPGSPKPVLRTFVPASPGLPTRVCPLYAYAGGRGNSLLAVFTAQGTSPSASVASLLAPMPDWTAKSPNTLPIEVPITRLTFETLTTGELPHSTSKETMNLGKNMRTKELYDLADRLQSDVGSYEGMFTFPLEHIIACLRDDRLQGRHSHAEALKRYKEQLAQPAENVVFFYFESPAWTWENLCGRAGWLVIRKEPSRQVAFFLEIMN
jgi:hypothetical protein